MRAVKVDERGGGLPTRLTKTTSGHRLDPLRKDSPFHDLLGRARARALMRGAWPSKDIVRKYPRSVLRQSMTPFLTGWKTKVHPDDVPIFERNRNRFTLRQLVLLATLALVFVYLHVRYIATTDFL